MGGHHHHDLLLRHVHHLLFVVGSPPKIQSFLKLQLFFMETLRTGTAPRQRKAEPAQGCVEMKVSETPPAPVPLSHGMLGMTPPSQGLSALGTGPRKAEGSPSLEKFKPQFGLQ